jgi:hypothetical protein
MLWPIPEVIGPDTDWERAVLGLCDARVALDRIESIDDTSPEDYQQFAVKRLDPALRAARLGHVVEWDPPPDGQRSGHGSARRWTCIACYEGLFVQGTRIYGKPVTGPCLARPS